MSCPQRKYLLMAAEESLWRDVAFLLGSGAVLLISGHNKMLRGITYRKTVLPVWQERVWKFLFYVSLLGVVDGILRWAGQALLYVGVLVPPASAVLASRLRMALLHVPVMIWAFHGPLSDKGSTRDDRCFSAHCARWSVWRFVASWCFQKPPKIQLSEEWLDLTSEQRETWCGAGNYVGCLHPHGLLPLGAIVSGLTWADGGLENDTVTGQKLPWPSKRGTELHQRWFVRFSVRAAVASGAVGLMPVFYDLFGRLGFFECTKPFIKEVMRKGRTVFVFPGGAEESKYAHPGRYVCCVKNRSGFVRLALEERHNLLPIWTFGDEGLVPIDSDPPVAVASLQRFFRWAIGLHVPVWITSPLNLRFPFPPTTTVIGVPVSLEDLWPKDGSEVSDSAVAEGHRRYIEAQRALFDMNKGHVAGNHGKAVLEVL